MFSSNSVLVFGMIISVIGCRQSSCSYDVESRRRYVFKHNLITEVYLMNVMENNYMFRPVLAIIRLSMELKG